MNASDSADLTSWDSKNAAWLVVWAIRLWTHGRACDLSVAPAIRVAFSRADVPQAAGVLERLMRVMDKGLCRDMRVHCICKQVLTSDEVLLLEIFERVQSEDCHGAMAVMECLFTPQRCQQIYDVFDEFVFLLKDAGLEFSSADLASPLNSGETAYSVSSRVVH